MTIEEYNRIVCLVNDNVATPAQCRVADAWLKNTTLATLRKKLPKTKAGDYAFEMACYHYGSGETDEFLSAMKCYPKGILRL